MPERGGHSIFHAPPAFYRFPFSIFLYMDYDFSYHGPVVVFDLDDTLFRERDFCRSGFREIERMLVKERGPEWRGVSKRLDTLLRKRENYFGWLEKQLGGDGISRYVERYRNHLPERLPIAPHVAETLDALAEHGVVMALITDGRSVTQRRKIEALGLNRYIRPEDILISEETGHDKRVADNFQAIVRRWPEAKGFIYVGDNVAKDFLMPNLLGWTTIQVDHHPDNVHPRVSPTEPYAGAALTITDFSQLQKHVLE